MYNYNQLGQQNTATLLASIIGFFYGYISTSNYFAGQYAGLAHIILSIMGGIVFSVIFSCIAGFFFELVPMIFKPIYTIAILALLIYYASRLYYRNSYSI